MLYNLLYKTVLTRIDPELIHDVCLDAIEITGKIPLVRDVVRQMWGRRPVFPVPSANQGGPFARPVPGILGLAAGMDKEGQAVEGLDMLGFGFIEVGTFTAHPQGGNDKPRMWRYPQMRAVRNRMGFNNSGADEAAKRLRALRRTPRGRSADRAARRHVPLLVKIAPDLADEDVDAVAQMVLDMGLDGVVATNTTIDHDLGEGGLSGAPLLPRALEVVRRLRRGLGQEPTIIGVGGISSVMDAELMLDAGADLLQAYTAFIYNGPAWPGRINRALATGSAARATA